MIGADGAAGLGQLACVEDSRGLPCVLIHGFGEAGYVWNRTAERLAAFCRPVRPDLRGHGASGRAPRGHGLHGDVQDLLDLIDSLELDRLVIVGHSLGAAIALALEARLRDRVVGLGLVDPSSRAPHEAWAKVVGDLAGALRTYPTREAFAAALQASRPLLSGQTAREVALAALEPADGGYRLRLDPALVERRPERDLSPVGALGEVRCPTLIVRGLGSAVLSQDAARGMLGELRSGRLVTVPRAGHGLLLDNPEASAAAIGEFVATLIGAG